jgi:hypothetical protein
MMTYNFDPDRWYENEYAALKVSRRAGKISEQELENALADLWKRYEDMLDRLDGTYQLPNTV